MRKIWTIGAFLVVGLFGLYYLSTLFSVPFYAPTAAPQPELSISEVGVAVAQTFPVMSRSYPVEDFTADTVYEVIQVIDGNTVKINYQGASMSVQLIGVDTPETVHPNKPVEAYGKEASNFMKNLLHGESVYLRFDAEKTDKYNRLLAYLYRVPDGLFVNLEIVRQGYGYVYTRFPFKHIELFRYYGNRARAAGKGLYEISQSAGEVYVTRTGAKYHRDGCKWLSRSKIPISLAEAKQRYGPCGWCNPPR